MNNFAIIETYIRNAACSQLYLKYCTFITDQKNIRSEYGSQTYHLYNNLHETTVEGEIENAHIHTTKSNSPCKCYLIY